MFSLFRKIFIGYMLFSVFINIYYLGKLSNGTAKTLSRTDYLIAVCIDLGMIVLAVFT